MTWRSEIRPKSYRYNWWATMHGETLDELVDSVRAEFKNFTGHALSNDNIIRFDITVDAEQHDGGGNIEARTYQADVHVGWDI